MAEPNVSDFPTREPLPASVEIDPEAGFPPHSPKETSLLEEQTGRSFADLTKGGGDAERLMVWFKLRRMGYEPTWDEAGDVLIVYAIANPPASGSYSGSPPSADSGA